MSTLVMTLVVVGGAIAAVTVVVVRGMDQPATTKQRSNRGGWRDSGLPAPGQAVRKAATAVQRRTGARKPVAPPPPGPLSTARALAPLAAVEAEAEPAPVSTAEALAPLVEAAPEAGPPTDAAEAAVLADASVPAEADAAPEPEPVLAPPVVVAVTDVVIEPAVPSIEPVAEPVIEPVLGPVAEPVVEPVAEPVAPVTEHVVPVVPVVAAAAAASRAQPAAGPRQRGTGATVTPIPRRPEPAKGTSAVGVSPWRRLRSGVTLLVILTGLGLATAAVVGAFVIGLVAIMRHAIG